MLLFFFAFADALLADLQNSVPGHQPPQHYSTTNTVTSVQQQRQVPQQQQQQQQHNYIESSSGYGSLRGKVPPTTQVCLLTFII